MASRDSRNWPLPSSVTSATTGDTDLGEKSNYIVEEAAETQVVGTTRLYENGELRFIPVSCLPAIANEM